MRIMPPANLPPRSSRAAAAHGRRGQRRRRRICAGCFKVITKPDSRAQPESSFLPCRIPTRLVGPRHSERPTKDQIPPPVRIFMAVAAKCA